MPSNWTTHKQSLAGLEEQIAELERLNQAEHLDLADMIADLRKTQGELMQMTMQNLGGDNA